MLLRAITHRVLYLVFFSNSTTSPTTSKLEEYFSLAHVFTSLATPLASVRTTTAHLQPIKMDNVPATFPESDQVAEACHEKYLELVYSLYDEEEEEWALRYKLNGWPHLKKKELSREVVSEMSKNISFVHFSIEKFIFGDEEEWQWIDPEEEDEVLEPILDLEGVFHYLDLTMDKDASKSLNSDDIADMISRYSRLFQKYTSVGLRYFYEPHVERLVERMASTGRLEAVEIYEPISRYESYNWRFWVDYFFSRSCKSLHANFKDMHVVLEVIKRWKEVAPQTLSYPKVFKGIAASPEDLAGSGITPLVSVDPQLCKKIDQKVARRWQSEIESLHSIEHPADKAYKIYVAFTEESYCFGSCTLLFEQA
uniref:Uncharacterized protein n=1 Tax=Steinernema glaseri TaxID=37863 RepID=A0A1I8ACU6_9BILA